jgi:hypothetical protein
MFDRYSNYDTEIQVDEFVEHEYLTGWEEEYYE